MKRIGIVFGVILALAVCLFIQPYQRVDAAKPQSTYYTGNYSGKKDEGCVKTLEKKTGKIIVKGSFYKADKPEKLYTDNPLKYQKYEFKLSKNCRYTGSGGEETIKYSKYEFFEMAKSPNYLQLTIVTDKDGTVIAMDWGS